MPEQIVGKRGDVRSDLYSLGVVLYELTTGVLPYPSDDPFYAMNARLISDPPAPRKLNPAISEGLEEIILKAMAREPQRRYQSAAEMRADLAAPEKVKVTGWRDACFTPRRFKFAGDSCACCCWVR